MWRYVAGRIHSSHLVFLLGGTKLTAVNVKKTGELFYSFFYVGLIRFVVIGNDLGGRGGSRSSSSSSSLQEVAEDDDDSIISGGSGGGGSIQEQCIGEYSGVTRTLYLERCSDVYWPGPNPPKDQTITRIVPNRVNMTIYVALCIIASLGIVLAISFLIINIKFRHQK